MSSTIDWSKAPEGATHFVCGSICPWEKRAGDLWYYWSSKKDWVPLNSPDCRGDARISASNLSIIARPIRTPEQVATETRESTVDEMVDVWRRTMGRFALEERGLAEMLYDAGYRKVEQP